MKRNTQRRKPHGTKRKKRQPITEFNLLKTTMIAEKMYRNLVTFLAPRLVLELKSYDAADAFHLSDYPDQEASTLANYQNHWNPSMYQVDEYEIEEDEEMEIEEDDGENPDISFMYPGYAAERQMVISCGVLMSTYH